MVRCLNHLVMLSGLLLLSAFIHSNAETLEVACLTTSSCEPEKPLWEAGLAAAVFYGPDYPAADQSHANPLVVPYFIYRGEVVRAGEGGLIKAQAFEDDRWQLSVSIDGAFNADSDDNDARQGMDDLDYLFGIGPELNYKLYQQQQQKLELKLQLRSVFSTDFSELNQRGYAFETQLRFEDREFFGQQLKFVGTVGPVWATDKLTRYFYQVDERDVTADRPRYDASGGYMGTDVGLGFVVPMFDKKATLFFGGRASFHHGAANDDSPLFLDKTTYAVGLGFAYRLFASDQLVR
ncbi:MipA/OmpV family protein [Neiella sp. HB171785]|uniref:MipA/OmpV family protein n=1 Tax=Neiella litorisoli TaxID=2771431 RepID=A0A8J6QUK1_9GAMM|nr:MipA/OmpV family protein [Neiella litorisoli]MBD1389128.1 MipA/OmpV family protein [Neiella litorisoli]